jgi:hypothetical protein
MGKTLSFPRNLSLHVLSRERESRSLKLLMSAPDWMPASAGMTNYDTASIRGRGQDKGVFHLFFLCALSALRGERKPKKRTGAAITPWE